MKHTRFAVHNFSDLSTAPFQVQKYSKLKFGSNESAKAFGRELAEEFFQAHSDHLLANRCVVISSPYNHVKNAATIMTEHFVNHINALLVRASGQHVEYSVIHRKVTYTNDYGFLSKEKRKNLIGNDSFYFNTDYLKGKTLIFIDDVYITGTHEEKLIEEMNNLSLDNDAFFLYYAKYHGNSPDIEGQLNFSNINDIEDLVNLTKEPEHHVIIRPIKFLLSQSSLGDSIGFFPSSFIEKVYFGCIAEGYYTIPAWQKNYSIIEQEFKKRNKNDQS